LVGWLVGWLVSWLDEWLIGWLVDWLVGWLFVWLTGYLIYTKKVEGSFMYTCKTLWIFLKSWNKFWVSAFN